VSKVKVELTKAQVIAINSALAYYQTAFESDLEGDAPFGMDEREASTELRVVDNARQSIWKQTSIREWLS